MRKLLTGAAIALAVTAAAGSAFWVVAAQRIEARIDRQIALLDASGVRVETVSRGVVGFPFAWRLEAEGLTAQDAAGLWRVEAPRALAEIGPESGARVRLALPQDARLAIDGQDFALAAEGLAFDPFPAADPAAGSGTGAGDAPPPAPRLTAERLTLSRAEGAQPASATFTRVALERASAAPGGRAALLRAETLDLSLPGLAEARLEAVEMAAQADGLAASSLAAFQAAHGAASAEILAARATLAATAPMALDAETGPARLSLRIDAQGASASASAVQVVPRLQVAGGATIAHVEAAMTLPLRPGPEPGRYAMSVALRDAAGDAAFWSAVDPGGALSHDPAQLRAEISGDADLRAPGDPGARPLRVRTVEIERFTASGLGATAEATGLLRVRPGEPTPDGRISLRVENWRETLEALRTAGLIGPDQAELATLMAETYGRPGETPGVLVSDIRLQGGAVYANGERLR